MSASSKLTAVIIDDNDVSRSMLRHILNSEQRFKVVGEAGNGMLGLQLVERLNPDFVCLDVEMHESDGLDTLAQIKRQWPSQIVLMVTGSKDARTVKTAMETGASGYVVKPFYPDALLRAIDSAFSKRGI